jgi:hypothetical protein
MCGCADFKCADNKKYVILSVAKDLLANFAYCIIDASLRSAGQDEIKNPEIL